MFAEITITLQTGRYLIENPANVCHRIRLPLHGFVLEFWVIVQHYHEGSLHARFYVHVLTLCLPSRSSSLVAQLPRFTS